MNESDLKQNLKHLYNPLTEEVSLVDIPSMNFIMIEGDGKPHTSNEYQNSVEALIEVSYRLNLLSRKHLEINFTIMPVEILYWNGGESENNFLSNLDTSKWKAMIRQPEFITKDLFDEAVKMVEYKGHHGISDKIEYESFYEGLAVQILDIGYYNTQYDSTSKIKDYMKNNSLMENGKYHEIYISGLRKYKLEKIKTILRQPVKQINIKQ